MHKKIALHTQTFVAEMHDNLQTRMFNRLWIWHDLQKHHPAL